MAPQAHLLYVITENNIPIFYTYSLEQGQRALLHLAEERAVKKRSKWVESNLYSSKEGNVVEVRCRNLGYLVNGSEYVTNTFSVSEVTFFKTEDKSITDLLERIKASQKILTEAIKEDEEDIIAKSVRIISEAEKLLASKI